MNKKPLSLETALLESVNPKNNSLAYDGMMSNNAIIGLNEKKSSLTKEEMTAAIQNFTKTQALRWVDSKFEIQQETTDLTIEGKTPYMYYKENAARIYSSNVFPYLEFSTEYIYNLIKKAIDYFKTTPTQLIRFPDSLIEETSFCWFFKTYFSDGLSSDKYNYNNIREYAEKELPGINMRVVTLKEVEEQQPYGIEGYTDKWRSIGVLFTKE